MKMKSNLQKWIDGNNAGQGYAVGDDDSDINDLAETLGLPLIERASNDRDIAVYSDGVTTIAVGDANGPWAVRIIG